MVFYCEMVMNLFFVISDLIMIYQRITAYRLTKTIKIGKRTLIEILVTFCMVLDAVLFHTFYGFAPYIRWGRVFRPVKVVLLSHDLYKTI